jgi:hypothetical protein
MPLYFLIEDGALFHEEVRPALAASWRFRSFAPCVPLCGRIATAARDFAIRFHLADQENLVTLVAAGMPFDRTTWRHLAGEILWFGAEEIPQIETNLSGLCALIEPTAAMQADAARPLSPATVQAHRGSHDLTFGGAFYRPESAGWNDLDDVKRLSAFLDGVRPATWNASNLAVLPDLPPEEWEEELAFLRDWFPSLQEMYRTAAQKRRIVICEEVDQ